jgi:hypothetical protein
MGMLYFSERGRRKLDRLGIMPLVDEEDGVECPAQGKAIVAFPVECNLYDEFGEERLATTIGIGYMAVWDGVEIDIHRARVHRYYSDRWLLTARLRRWWILRQAIRSLRQF